jgi:uncharacterized membrane protein YwaF
VIHGLILAFFVWLFMSGEVVPNYKGLWQAVVVMFLLYVPVYFLDGAFGVNYMFIGMRSDVGILAALWDKIVPVYGRTAFAVVLAVIMIVVMHVFYGIYFLLGKIRNSRKAS